jgi:hypothetical protein
MPRIATLLATAALGASLAVPAAAQGDIQQLLQGLMPGNQRQDQAPRDYYDRSYERDSYDRSYERGRQDEARRQRALREERREERSAQRDREDAWRDNRSDVGALFGRPDRYRR